MKFSSFPYCIVWLVQAIIVSCITSTANADFIFSLGDVVGGGNGRGQQLAGNEGKDALSVFDGTFQTGNVWNAFAGVYPFTPVSGSPYIDGVASSQGTNLITSTGVSYNLVPGDEFIAYDYISKGRHVENQLLNLNGVTYSDGFGMNAGSVVTFDLSAFRSAANQNRLRFDSIFGMGGTGFLAATGVRGYAILSTESEVVMDFISPEVTFIGSSHVFSFDIPSSARYLTLTAGIVGGDGNHDHVGFGNAFITAVPEPSSGVLVGIGFFLSSLIRFRKT
jgi:hypothetical protein